MLRDAKVEGHWRDGGVIVRDNLVKIVIDTPDSLNHRRWMKQYKNRWRLKLEQTELWVVSYAAEVELVGRKSGKLAGQYDREVSSRLVRKLMNDG